MIPPPQGGGSALRLDNITKRFGAVLANDGISLAVRPGEVVALLGENGAGKTTLMNILFGHYVADAGSVEVFGRTLPPGDPRAALAAGVGMVHQHFSLAENMTAAENITLGTRPLWRPSLGRRAARARIGEISRAVGLAVSPDRLVAAMSVGERQRVEILKALYRDARVLILDEPTAVLTPAEADALFGTLRALVRQGLAVIFISHKLREVLAVADRILVLRAGRLAGERRAREATRAELAALMVGGELGVSAVQPPAPGPARLVLQGVFTSGRGGGQVLAGADLELRAGEITGLAGVAGNGQAALAGLVAGTERPAAGDFWVEGARVGTWSPRAALAQNIARIPEDRHATGTIPDMSVAENLMLEGVRTRFSRRGFLDRQAARRFAERVIRDYDVRCPGPEARVRLLSGGNMQKLILGRALHGEPKIILAHQPTRGLDVGAIAYVHRRLLEARTNGAAVLLISEDLDEIIELSDRIVVISRGKLSAPSARGERSARELGELMAGHGLGEAA